VGILRLSASFIGTIGCIVTCLPTLQGGDEKDLETARKVDAANMRRIAAALLSIAKPPANMIPSAAIVGKGNKPLLSWRVLALPYLGEGELFKQFRLDEPWDSPHNKKLLGKMPKVYAPARGKKSAYYTYYQVFVGGGAGFELDRGLPLSTYLDGLACTIMLTEAATAVPWTKPADLVYDPTKQLPKVGGTFPDGFHVAMFNGSVLYFRRDFDKTEMRHVITRAGNETMDFAKLKRQARMTR
jgi:hypothetical protein